MRDELTCWDCELEFTGLQAALAIVGEPNTDDPAALHKAMLVLERMRRSYEGTRRWFADERKDGDTEPRALLVSVEMQDAKDGNLRIHEVELHGDDGYWPREITLIGRPGEQGTYFHLQRQIEFRRIEHHGELYVFDIEGPYCHWPRPIALGHIRLPDELQRKASNLGFYPWLLSPRAEFDRQKFTREVLARWVQEGVASSAYSFACEPTEEGEQALVQPEADTASPRREKGDKWTEQKAREAFEYAQKHNVTDAAKQFEVSRQRLDKIFKKFGLKPSTSKGLLNNLPSSFFRTK